MEWTCGVDSRFHTSDWQKLYDNSSNRDSLHFCERPLGFDGRSFWADLGGAASPEPPHAWVDTEFAPGVLCLLTTLWTVETLQEKQRTLSTIFMFKAVVKDQWCLIKKTFWCLIRHWQKEMHPYIHFLSSNKLKISCSFFYLNPLWLIMNRDEVNLALDSVFSFPATTEAANYFFFVFKDQRIHTGCAFLLNEAYLLFPSVLWSATKSKAVSSTFCKNKEKGFHQRCKWHRDGKKTHKRTHLVTRSTSCYALYTFIVYNNKKKKFTSFKTSMVRNDSGVVISGSALPPLAGTPNSDA